MEIARGEIARGEIARGKIARGKLLGDTASQFAFNQLCPVPRPISIEIPIGFGSTDIIEVPERSVFPKEWLSISSFGGCPADDLPLVVEPCGLTLTASKITQRNHAHGHRRRDRQSAPGR